MSTSLGIYRTMTAPSSSNPIQRYGLARSDTSLRSARNSPVSASSSHQSNGTNMPLPNIASGRTPQCTARSKRSLRRCLNPAAYGMPVCRFHGARRPDAVLRGPKHPLYRHGQETLEARRNRVEAMTRIRVLTDLGVRCGFLQRRIPDRLICHRELLLLQR